VTGRRGSMVEIAKCNEVGKQYVSRLIRMAFLAPEMVERIAAGRQPPELTAQALRTGRPDIPWIGRRKSEPSALRRRSEHPHHSGLATILLLFQVRHESIYKLSPPLKMRTERNLQNSRLNPTRPILRWTLGAGCRPNGRFSRR
jgi:hypothetical protein